MPRMSEFIRLFEQHPTGVSVTAGSAVALLVLLAVALRRASRAAGRLRARVGDEQLLTVATSTIATGVAAQGMWGYFETLHIPVWLRVLFFAFLELMVVTSALRARASMRAGHGTGADGIAMWVLTCLSAVLSATHAASPGEVLLRLSAPLVAAWGWERSMSLERRARTGRSGLNWRLSPERLFVRLGLADPTDRTASEVDAHRRLMRLALAVQHARTTKAGIRDWRRKRATKRLNRAMEGAVEYGRLGCSPDSADTLTSTLGALVNASALLDLRPAAPWEIQTPAEPLADTVSTLSGRLAELEAAQTLAIAAPGQSQTPPDTDVFAGQPREHHLTAAVIAASEDGMSIRKIAAAFETNKSRVETILKSANDPAEPDTQTEDAEVSEEAAPVVEPEPAEPVADEIGPDITRRRFAVRVRGWKVTAEEGRRRELHTVNGHTLEGS